MFKIGEYVVYRRDVCKIREIREHHIHNDRYYILEPMVDSSLTIEVPTDNRCGFLRPLIDRQQVEQIINEIPNIPLIECNDRMIENIYKTLLNSGKHEDYIKIIKTTYLRNKEREANHKRIGDKDYQYFQKAENYLYNEFSIVLQLSVEETKKYVLAKVKQLEEV